MMDEKTKGERREERRRNARKMRVTGKSNQLLWQLIVAKAHKLKAAREKQQPGSAPKGGSRRR